MTRASEQKCLYCQAALENQVVTHLQEYQGKWYVIENVPALVCRQCGETYFTPAAHDHVVELITSQQPPIRFEKVAVYDAAIQ